MAKQGERRDGGAGRPSEGEGQDGWSGLMGGGGAAASPNSMPRRVNLSREDSPRLWGSLPLSASANLPAAAMTASSGVTAGAEMYLCLCQI